METGAAAWKVLATAVETEPVDVCVCVRSGRIRCAREKGGFNFQDPSSLRAWRKAHFKLHRRCRAWEKGRFKPHLCRRSMFDTLIIWSPGDTLIIWSPGIGSDLSTKEKKRMH